MPLYDHECECGKITERFMPYEQRTITCECGKEAKRIISFRQSARTVDVFNEYREENLGDDVPLVRSRAHLAQLCEERGLKSKALMDGYRNYGRRREI